MAWLGLLAASALAQADPEQDFIAREIEAIFEGGNATCAQSRASKRPSLGGLSSP